jgi:hypothetical protein|tara:strand:- start:184 stop:690 length:507 start_codon:yes stop_codon:yes gene_type:complete
MFGFGKRKKIEEQLADLLTPILGTYVIMRSLSQYRMEETKLEPMPLMMFEATYILGIIDCIGQTIDPQEEVLNQTYLIDACKDACVGFEIFDKSDVDGIFYGAILLQGQGEATSKLMYLGGTDTQTCLQAMMDKQDSTVISKAMGLQYLDDKELIESFKKTLSESGIN